MSTSLNSIAFNNPSSRLCLRAACRWLMVAALLLGVSAQAANTTNVFVGATNGSLIVAGNWSSGALPTAASDAVFDGTVGPGIRTLTNDLTMGSLNVTTNAGTYSIRNDTTAFTTNALTLGGGTGNSVLGANALDLIYVTNGATLNFIATNSAATNLASRLLITLATNGNFNISNGAFCNIGADINGAGFSVNKTGGGVLTISGNFSGSGGVTNSAGWYTNTSLSTYTGPTVFKTGTTNAFNSLASNGVASALGAPASGDNNVIHYLGGTMIFTGSATNISDRMINWSGGGSFYQNGSGRLILTGGITNTGTLSASFRGTGTIVVSGLVKLGTGAMTRTDGGTVIITNGLNEFTGTPQISDGKFFIDTIASNGVACSLGKGTQITLGQNGVPNTTTGTLQLAVTNGSLTDRTILIQCGTSGGGLIENTLAGTTVTFGGNVSSFTTNFVNSPTLTLAGVGNGVISGVIGATTNTVVGLVITKTGNGTWTLSGANTNQGKTTVSAGTLLINGNSAGATNTVTVNTGGTLGGTGTIGGTVTNLLNSYLAPGGLDSRGTLTLTNGLGLNGAILSFTLTNADAAGVTYDTLAVTNGAFVANGTNVVQIFAGTGTLTNGTYTLITNVNTRTGIGTFVFANGSTNLGNLWLTNGPNSVVLGVTADTANSGNLVWKGTVNGTWNTTDANWFNGTQTTFADGAYVAFDDTASQFTIAGGGSPAAVTFNNNANAYTVAAAIGGTGGLTKNSSAALTLFGASTYSGPTVLNGGNVSFNSLASNGSASSFGSNGIIVVTGGANLRFTNAPTDSISDRIINWAGGNLYNDSTNGSKLILTGGITNKNPAFRGNGTTVVSGLIQIGSGTLTRTDAGTVILTNALNPFTGNIQIFHGQFYIDTIANSGVNSSIGAGSAITLGQYSASSTGTLQLAVTNGSSTDRSIFLQCPASGGGTIENTLAGNTVTFGGNVTFQPTNNTVQPVLTLTGVGNGVLSGTIGINTNLLANPPIVKAGVGTWTLSGLNTNRGTVAVSAGKLLITGDSSGATNRWTVNAGGTLGGTNVIGGTVTNLAGSALAPGGLTSRGTLTLTNGLGLNGATLTFTLTNANTAGLTYDQLAVTNGTNVVNGVNYIQIIAATGTLTNGTYTLITNVNARTGTGTFVFPQTGTTNWGNLSLTNGANSVVLRVAANTALTNLTWKGAVNGTWNTSDANWFNGNNTTYAEGAQVTFDDTASLFTITNGTASPGTVSFANNVSNYVVGAAIGGSGTVTKNGAATTTLTGANTYSSNTIVNAGTLVVTNGGQINSPLATLNVGSAATAGTLTLASNGAINIKQLLSTNVVLGGANNSALNFNAGGALITSNAANAIAANIIGASNASFSINSRWTMSGGTNFIVPVNTNGSFGAIYIGNGVNNAVVTVNSNAVFSTQNPWITSASSSTNMAITIGNGVGLGGNQLIITNGGRVIARANPANGGVGINVGSAGNSGNSIVVAGADGSGKKAVLDLSGINTSGNANRLIIGGAQSTATNNYVLVGAGGVITNVTVYCFNGYTNGLTITNGGQVYAIGVAVGRSGFADYLNVAGADSAGNRALLAGANNANFDLYIGGSGGGPVNASTNCSVYVGQSGVVTNINAVRVGPDTNSFGNSLVIANGGQLFSLTASAVGALNNATNANNNFVTIGGNFGSTNSMWAMNGQTLTIGATNLLCTNNYLTLNTGGLLTNVSSVILGSVNSLLTFNGGTLAAGAAGNLIATNSSTLNATNYVRNGGAVINSGNFTITTMLPFLEDPGSTGGGLTKLGSGTLTLADVNTYTGPTLVSAGTLALSGSIDNSPVLVASGATFTNTASGVIAGTTGVTSSGTVALDGNNTYSGPTLVSAGKLLAPTGGSCANSAVTVLSGATNSVQLLTVDGQWTCAGLTQDDGSTFEINFRIITPSTGVAPLNVTGPVALTNVNINVHTTGGIGIGQYPLIKYVDGSSIGVLNATPSLPFGMEAYVTNNTDTASIDLVVTAPYVPAFKFYWAGGDGDWDTFTMNWKDTPAIGGANVVYTNNTAPVVLDDSASGTSPILVNITAPVTPSSLLVDVTTKDYTLSGSEITGTNTLTKGGSGTLTLNNPNTYAGDTLVNGGTLAVSGGGAINSPTNTLNIGSGATVATNTLAAGGAITVQTLLSTNVVLGGAANSFFNFAGGTLTTSNNNGLAANIIQKSNTAYNVHGSWNMNAGTNFVVNVATNFVSPTNYFGNGDNDLVFNVNSSAVLSLANPAINSTNQTLTIGSGNATNNVFTVNGGVVNNVNLFDVGSGSGSISNQLIITNGGQFTLGNSLTFSHVRGSYSSVIVAGTNAAGLRATLDLGGSGDRRIYVADNAAYTGNLLRVDAGGVLTNGGIQIQGSSGHSVVIANGGQAYLNSGISVGRNSGTSNSLVVVGFDGNGSNSLISSTATLDIGGSNNGGNSGTNNWARVDQGGVVKLSAVRVGGSGPDINSFGNGLIITNGGQVTTTNASTVGSITNGSSNWVFVGGNFGTTNSLWNLGSTTLTIGASSTNHTSTNNYVLLATGGVMTNVSSVILGGVNSLLTFNGGTLAAGTNSNLIATNVTTRNAANYVQTGGAIIDSANFMVTNVLPLLADPGSPNGGLTKLGAGTLVLKGANTYTGNTLVGAGMLAGASGGSSANSAVTVLAGATNSAMVVAANGQWTCAALANNDGSTLDINWGTFAPSVSTAPLQVTGAFDLTNANISVRGTAIIHTGQYPLVKYGSVSGTPTSATLSLPAGLGGYLSNNVDNLSIDLVVTNGFTGVYWKGYVNGVWDDAVNTNWLGSIATIFNNGDAVVFDDNLVGNTNVSSSAAVQPSSVTIINNLTNYVISAAIGGTGALTKSGAASLTLSGSNSFSGGVTLNAGTLALGSSNALGTGVFTINGGILDNKAGVFVSNVNNNLQIWNTNITFAGSAALNLGTGAVTITTNLTITGSTSVLAVGGNISGTGGLTHSGNGALLLSGALGFSGGLTNTAGTLTNSGLNTYPGATALTGGTLYYNSLANVGQASALGQPANAADGVITVSNSNIRFIGTADSTSDRVFSLYNSTFYNDSTTGKLILTGGFTNNNNSGITFRGVGTNVVSGLIDIGTGGVTRTDGGMVIFTNQLNPYTGNVTIQDGYFYIDTIANSNAPCAIGAGASITLGQVVSGTVGRLQLAVTNGSSSDRAIIILAQNASSGGLIENTIAGRTVTFSGPVTSQITNASVGPTLTLAGLGNGVLSGVLGINTNPAVAMNLAKTGSGTWAISGLNTNRGTVAVNAGTLLINGNSAGATNTVTVALGASFGGTGTNGGPVTLSAGGILVPGGLASVGKLTLNNNLTLNGSTLYFDLGNVASVSDQVAVGSALNLNGANSIHLSFPGGLAPAGTYTLMTMGSTNGVGTFALAGSYTNVLLNVSATSVTLVVSNGGTYADNYTWNGNVNGTWDAGTANWVNNGVAGAVYANALDVTFDDTLTANPAVSSSGTVLPNSVTFNNSSTAYTIAATIGGTSALTKNGTATTALTGANTYTGNTVVNAGVLVVTNGGVINSPSATLNVGSGVTVAANTLAGGGAITVQTLLATNVVNGGVNNSLLNFTGGTLTTSNNNGIASSILLASNTSLTLNSSWNLNGGTNILSNVGTNSGANASVIFGNAANDRQLNVNPNATLWLAIPTNSFATNTLQLMVGNGNATNNVLTVNGGTLIVTNTYGQTVNIPVGNGSGAFGNQMIVTNGGQVFTHGLGTTGPQAVSVGAGGNNNSLLVAGTNAAGRKALLDCGSDRCQAGGGGGSGNWIRVDQGGIITNAYFIGYYLNSSLTIANGGEMFPTGLTVGRNGSNVSVVISGADAGGNKAMMSFVGFGTNGPGVMTIGGGSPSGGNPGSNNWVRVDAGGLITNASTIYVGGNNLASDINNQLNSLIITNGGQVYSTNGGTIGNSTNNNNNWVSLGGGAGQSLWNLGNTSLTIGNQAVSTNNHVTLFAGGSLTNVSAVVLSGVNSVLNFNGGMLAAGTNGNLIATNAATVNATNFVLNGGAIIDSVGFMVTNELPLLEDPGSLGGGLTKHGVGTLVLSAASTYSGTTLVSAGVLLVDNATGSGTGTNTVTVASGATLGGSGTIAGSVTLQSGASATNTAGTYLTIAGAVVLNGNPMTVGSTSTLGIGDYLLITNTSGGISGSFASGVTVGGAGLAAGTSATIVTTANAVTLRVAAVTTLQLVSSLNPSTNGNTVTFTATVQTNSVTATAASGNIVFKVGGLPVATNLVSSGAAAYVTGTLPVGTHAIEAEYSGAANYLPSTNSTLSQVVVSAGPSYPATGTNINFTPISGGNTFDLTWPAEYIGWQLQSNAVDVSLTNYWFLVPGSTTTNKVTITIDPSQPNVFYRMRVQLP